MADTDPLSQLRGRPGIIRLHGHRGARGVLPENTLVSMRHALDCRLNAVEFDVRFSRDAVPVVTHDARLSPDIARGPDGRWLDAPGPAVNSLPLREIRQYRVGELRPGSAYAARFCDQAMVPETAIPTLDEVAALLAGDDRRGVWLNLEIKWDPHQDPDALPPERAIGAILDVLGARAMLGRTLIQSFDWRLLQELARQAPEVARSALSALPRPALGRPGNVFPASPLLAGFSPDDFAGSLPRMVQATGAAVWSPRHSDLTDDDLTLAHELGLIVNTWTVNAAKDIDRMIELGVDGIITDYPGRAQQRLAARSMSWRAGWPAAPQPEQRLGS